MSFLSNIAFTVVIPAFLITLMLTSLYKLIAKKAKIIAKINSRSLHKSEVPRGAGLVFSWVVISKKIGLYEGFFFENWNSFLSPQYCSQC